MIDQNTPVSFATTPITSPRKSTREKNSLFIRQMTLYCTIRSSQTQRRGFVISRRSKYINLAPLLALAFLFLLPNFAPAQTTAWQSTISSWFTPANWTNGLPDSSTTANIDNTGAPQIASGSAAAFTLALGSSTSSTGSLFLSNTGALSAANEYIGAAGSGSVLQTGGSNTVSNTLYLANTTNASAVYNLSAGSLSTANLFIGYGGPNANFSQFGGSLSVTQNLSVLNQGAALFINNASDTVHFTQNAGAITLGGATSTSAPGNLNSTTGFNESANAILSLTLGGPTPQTQYPQITTSSTTLAGTLDVFLGNNFTPFPGETFTLITYTSHTGNFSHIFLPTVPQGDFLNITPTAVVLTIVPEPTSLGIMTLISLTLLCRRNCSMLKVGRCPR